MYESILVHIPHAVPATDFNSWSNPCSVKQEADKWTDTHIDVVFRDPENRVQFLKATRSRYVVDMERLKDDPMEAQGQGIIYTMSKDGKSRRTVSDAERKELMEEYDLYHERLRSLTAKKGTLIIDAHSYPSEYDEAGNASGEDVDVCIGFNEDASRPPDSVINTVKAHFANANYKVGINRPFANSIVGAEGTHSIMIELNKRIYVNEKTLDLRPDAYKLNYFIADLYTKLLK